jgi:hypothetical protein
MATQEFDIASLVSHYGGRTGIHAKLVGAGMKITVRAVDQWLYRDRMPTNVLATLIRVSIIDGHPLDLASFTRRSGDEHRTLTPDLNAISTLLD